MTLVASGDLHLKGTVGAPTRSIEYEVQGGISGVVNLTTLRSQADPAFDPLPVDMTDFYSHTQAGLPNAPTKCNTQNAALTIKAIWFDTSSDETGFDIEWSVDSGAFGNAQTVGANVTEAHYSGTCFKDSTYACRVRSYNLARNSAWCTDGSPVTAGSQCVI